MDATRAQLRPARRAGGVLLALLLALTAGAAAAAPASAAGPGLSVAVTPKTVTLPETTATVDLTRAYAANTINYEVVTRISPRVPRYYIQGSWGEAGE